MLAEKATAKLLHSLQQLKCGQFEIELPNGRVHRFAGANPGPSAHLQLHDYRVISNMVLKGDIALVEDYRLGRWHSRNPAALVECALRNEEALQQYIHGSRLQQLLARVSYLFNTNTRKKSRQNIYAHYDLGNDFYSLWLDPGMTYSSALFYSDEEDLTKAQSNKYDRILQVIGNRSKSVIEIGCGWGGFIERCLGTTNHQIKGVTISPAQLAYARNRIDHNLSRSQIQLEDYRDLTGKYDNIVSIEMFEAVGERYWKTYFNKIRSLLKAKGSAVIQAITIDNAYFDNYRLRGDAIRSYIFPGGMLPSCNRFRHEAESAGLQIADQYFFGQDYVTTLTSWLHRFESQLDAVRSQGFDESFIRLWRFYLASCIGSFAAERTNVMQVELRHA